MHVSNVEDATSESVDVDYATTLDNDSVRHETLVASTTYYRSNKNNATTKNLSKIWKISQETTQCIINNTPQRYFRQIDPKMKLNYKINDRTLRHKRLDQYFYKDTFCVTKANSMKSMRESTCCHLFVTETGCAYFCPLENQSDALLSIKLFAKDIASPESLNVKSMLFFVARARVSKNPKLHLFHI